MQKPNYYCLHCGCRFWDNWDGECDCPQCGCKETAKMNKEISVQRTEQEILRNDIVMMLKDYRGIQFTIESFDKASKNMLTQIETQRELSGVQYSDEAAETTKPYSDPTAENAITIKDVYEVQQAQYVAQLEGLMTVKKSIEYLVHLLPEKSKKVLAFRFLGGMRWHEVADEMSYSVGQIRRLSDDAIDELVRMVSEREELSRVFLQYRGGKRSVFCP